MKTILFYLKVSRPGLWFPTLWLYMMPLSQTEFWEQPIFWLGLAYVLFPMNFMVYGWNDIVDYEADLLNPRKDSFLFGARGTRAQLNRLPLAILIVQILTYPVLVYFGGWELLPIFAAQLLVLWAYNFPGKGLRSMPPFEMICQFGYLLVVPFSVYLNDVGHLPWQSYIYLLLFAVQAHLMGEVMDIDPDRAAGKTTTATLVGRQATKILIMVLVVSELLLVYFVFEDLIFSAMLLGLLLWLMLDAFVIYKQKKYSLKEMKLFGIASNVMALATMMYVWYSGCINIVP